MLKIRFCTESEMIYQEVEGIEGLQLVLPRDYVKEVLSGLHDSPVGGHLGARKTLQKVSSHFY